MMLHATLSFTAVLFEHIERSIMFVLRKMSYNTATTIGRATSVQRFYTMSLASVLIQGRCRDIGTKRFGHSAFAVCQGNAELLCPTITVCLHLRSCL